MTISRSFFTGFLVVAFLSARPFVALAFSDVTFGDAYHVAISYVRDQGIVRGYEDGTYRPYAPINRAEFIKIVMGATAEVDFADTSVSGLRLRDLEAGAWYVPYVRAAVERGVVSGYDDGTYRPANPINFAEAAKIVVNAFGLEARYQQSSEDPWYRVYVEVLGNQRAIPATIPSFDHRLTRGEMAEMIYRLHAGVVTLPSATYGELAGEASEAVEPAADLAVTTDDTVADPEVADPVVAAESPSYFWSIIYDGYGTVDREPAEGVLYLSPMVATEPGETHAALMRADERLSGNFELRFRFVTLRQLREGSAPNPWEVAWLAWGYDDLIQHPAPPDQQFTYLILKPNGIELGEALPDDGQNFLYTSSDRLFPVGEEYDVTIRVEDEAITVFVNGEKQFSFDDPSRRTLTSEGYFAFYTEDAEVRLYEVEVTAL